MSTNQKPNAVKGLKPWLVKDFPERLRMEFIGMVHAKGGRVPFVVATLVSRYLREERQKE